MKDIGIIYIATNKINNKFYIGQTTRGLKERKRKHLNSKDKFYFSRAIKKYGKNNFCWEIICECPKQDLNEQEIFWIKYFETANPEKGYNILKGGQASGGFKGHNHSEKSKKQISEKMTIWHSENKHPMLGYKHSDETIDKLKIANSGENNGMFGKKHSNGAKKKMADKAKNRIHPKYDTEIYKFYNKISNELYIGKRLDFCKKFNLSKAGVNSILKGSRKSYKKWAIITN